MNLEHFVVVSEPFMENTYILWQQQSKDAIIVDPGTQPQLIIDALSSRNLTAKYILNTHGHIDHIAGNAAMKEAFPDAPLVIGKNDAPMLTNSMLNLSFSYGMEILSPEADSLVHDQDQVNYCGIPMLVREIPGHSPGHVAFIIHDAKLVIGGDVLFREGIGRTDFPGGSHELLLSGIREKLFTLPGDYVVLPGHGPETTIDYEKANNPFLM